MVLNRIGRVSLTTADADRLGRFYRQAFGFEAMETEHYGGTSFAQLTGVEGSQACAFPLRLGEETIELVAFARPGAPYPADIGCNDPRFQHIAIVVADMEAAYSRLCACEGWTAITRPAPQRLPASAGGVTAFKFRDPEGHPLELLAFPPDNVPLRWREAPHRDGPCLGIDHSAIVVSGTAPSIAFYGQVLGFSLAGGSLNRGREQEQLDAVPGAVVEVTALDPGAGNPPHLELLCYRSPSPRRGAPAALRSNDIAATRFTLEVDDVPALERRLAAARVPFISTGTAALRDNRPALLIRDPDGHALLLLGRYPSNAEAPKGATTTMKATEGEAFVMSGRLVEISELVADLPLSRVMLANDARFPWLMLIPRRANMQELFDLTAAEQGMLMREITAVSRMLKELTKADKINVEAIGNATPQLHVHVVARYKTDSQWPKGVQWGDPQPYTEEKRQSFLSELRAGLRKLGL